MRDIEEIDRYVRDIRLRNYARDQRMGNVQAVRSGDISHIVPGLMPDIWPKPIVANIIRVSGEYTAEQIGIMPTIQCSAGVMVSDRQKKYAETRTLIAQNYVDKSRFSVTLVQAADYLNTYGFLPILVEPFFGDKYCPAGPRMRFEHPTGSYYDCDAYGQVRYFCKVHSADIAVLAAKFPNLATRLVDDPSELLRNTKIELVQYYDETQIVTYIPSRSNLVVNRIENKFGRVPVFVAERPRFDEETRGAFDDVIWVHLAKSYMAMMAMELTQMTVDAPLVVPMDMQKVVLGKNAILRTNNPQMARKMEIPINPAQFNIQQLLSEEALVGARFPEGATGKSPGSVVTGRGMQELMGTIDTKVKTYQVIMADAIMKAIGACFEMDEKFWPRMSRDIRVQVNGAPYERTYTPRKDINGAYQVDVTYGMAAGMDPNRALVFLLQARGDKLISRDYALRQLPFDLNPDQIQEQIDTEELNDALKQGMLALLTALPQMAQIGQDPVDIITKAADAISARESGQPFAQALLKAFQPKNPPPGSAPPGATPPPSLPGGPQGGPGMQAPGGGAPPQLPQGQGGQPDILSMLAGLSGGGQPNMQAAVKRQQPAG